MSGIYVLYAFGIYIQHVAVRNQYGFEVFVRKFQCKRDKKEKARVNNTMRPFMICVICQILRG